MSQIETMTDDEVLMAWHKAKADLVKATELERTLRLASIARKFPAHDDGTNNLALGSGWVLKAVFNTRYTLGGAVEVNAALDKIVRTGAEGKVIADRVVKWSPDLILSEYRTLIPAYKTHIDKVLTTKPSMPTLDLIPPKGTVT